MLIETFVDAVKKDRHRRVNRPQAWGEVPVGIAGTALEVARWKIQEPDEVIDDAVKLFVGDQSRQSRVDFEPLGLAEVFEDRHRDCREPHLSPREG